ncbi:hypothetical protein [Citrobacter farmeri]|uniref:hypothetical protein n=1 Tax=Citrobacter farmeri TaxID=67824 RepID=UPI0012DB96FA|nr:hypothetical protein [Citrobacter farmeri]EBW6663756.1 hypothetical protein [Salmonella enterica subsp. enterica serovar Reading]MDB2181684.1 hypothetical protein [Citrobacter farmeri]
MKIVCVIVVFLSLIYAVTVNIFEPSVISQSTKYYEENDIKNGGSDASYIQKYGIPTRVFIRPRHEFVGEYNIGLNQTYPITSKKFENIPIKEIFWHLREDLNLTCWFHYKDGQWRVISYIFWPPGAKF